MHAIAQCELGIGKHRGTKSNLVHLQPAAPSKTISNDTTTKAYARGNLARQITKAVTRCTDNVWPAQVSKLQPLLEAQEDEINKVMNRAEKKLFDVLDEK